MNNINPWIGLNSYQEGQILYGRSREIQDLSMLVFYNRQTVIYGKSGIGKSSLLHAGIFPMARLRGCLPISVRFDHASELSYRQQLIHRITESVLAANGTMGDNSKDADEPKSLWEFFHRMQPQKDGQIITPLIVIDQFEEIFTLSKNTQAVRAFFDELADLFNNVMPDYLNSDNAIQKTKETGSIFDGLSISSADRFEQEMSYHMVFVLREDYLSFLERYAAHIPALKQNRYGLLPITYQQAMEIITKPCEGLVNVEVADSIIRHITTEQDINDETPVDSAILSLYLSRLFEKKKDAPTISMQLVKEQGDALIEDFYAEVVASTDRKTIEYLEDVLINTDGHRENVTIESLHKKAGIDPSAIEKLEHAHLLRIFSYGNVQRGEFAHDVLCPIIVRRRSQRQNVARMRKVQRIGILVMLALVIVLFGSLYIILEREESKASLDKQQARLSEMEVSLIEKGTNKMLDNHDFYGAIRLLINSLGEDLSNPSLLTARKELDLRVAAYYALFSQDTCVAKVNYQFSLPYENTAVLSRSKRLIGVNDNTGVVVIIDSHTGAIVSCLSKHNINPYDGVFAQENADNWKCYVQNDKTKYTYESYDSNIILTDISNDDKRCLIIADDTTLLDCWIFQGEDWWKRSDSEFGSTRLCLHHFKDSISNAAYSNNGDTIAVQLLDSSYYLFNSANGKEIITANAIEQATHIIGRTEPRQLDLLKEDIGNDRVWYPIQINENITVQPTDIREFAVYHYNKKGLEHANKIDIYQPSVEMITRIRAHLDTLPLPSHLTHFSRSYYLDENGGKTDKRYHWPVAVNKDETRIALLQPEWRNHYSISCIYASTGYQFFQISGLPPVHTIHFTEDDQYLVVNYGEEAQEVIYLPPLEQLVNSCKNMFFDWQMTEEERYQTYIHMND